MSKQRDTKNRIIRLISEGNNNLTKISEALDLAPSTVSKHLHDLEVEGAISLEKNPHVKKWKYYRVGPARSEEELFQPRPMRFNRMIISSVIVLVLAVSAAYMTMFRSSSSGTVYVPISITDPPQVPNGTQSLYINYSSLSMHVSYNGNSEWITVNSSGTLNLMSLVNATQVIGGTSLKVNSTVDEFSFNITSASVTIKNVTYPVELLKKQVTATVDNTTTVGKYSNILLDFSPVVTPVYTENSTAFVMLPAVKALFVSDREMSMRAANGSAPSGPYPLQTRYRDMFSNASANVSVESATLNTDGNVTTLNVELQNKGLANVTVLGLALFGEMVPYATLNTLAQQPDVPNVTDGQKLPGISQQSNANVIVNLSSICPIGSYLGTNVINIRLPQQTGNVSVVGITDDAGRKAVEGGMTGMASMHPEGVSFIVSNSGALSVASPYRMPDNGFPSGMPDNGQPMGSLQTGQVPFGFELGAGSTATLSYNGTLSLTGSWAHAELSGGSYRLVIATDRGMVLAKVTAS